MSKVIFIPVYREERSSGDTQRARTAGQDRAWTPAPVVVLQAQGQATQGRDLSTLAPLRALRSRTPDRAWVQRAVGEGV